MPDIKEKIVALLDEASDALRELAGGYNDGTGNEVRADHLIANGVTTQQWISVEEGLPEDVGDYLVVVKSKYAWETDYRVEVDVAGYNPYEDRAYIDGCWNTFNDWNEGEEYLHITHWMSLPEPPKGE